MEKLLGILAASGHDLTVLDTHTWDQLVLMARGIIRHEIARLDMLFTPIAAAFGVEYKPGSVSGGGAKTKATEIDHTDAAAVQRAEQRDAKIFAGLTAMGIRVEDV